MKKNSNVVLAGKKVFLVPYRKEHVEIYHNWMKSEELLELTASEPLTLEQEYEMQDSWFNDEKKCTFILVAKNLNDTNKPEFWQSAEFIIGDVNLYLNDTENPNRAEIEVMIAEPEFRNKGIATEALNIMMNYAFNDIGISCFYCRILDKNLTSINLFKRLGYVLIESSEYFKESTFELNINDSVRQKIVDDCAHVIKQKFLL
ncbi:hypothetical protein BB561_002923 [Smittium simulii]|uniref:N-acetyltransferase domain-containing protein n=1 Tax=Smittium simulii TaxID=133385 RepID=A0A2T9YNK1_9FUNG|nr:hypothetical protein BB561_002923 [Smittium simulii]